jgi:hypothetical protein
LDEHGPLIKNFILRHCRSDRISWSVAIKR